MIGIDRWPVVQVGSERGEEEEGSRATGDFERVVSACGGAGVRSWRFAAERQKNKHLSLVLFTFGLVAVHLAWVFFTCGLVAVHLALV